MKIFYIFSNYHLSHITAQPGIAYKLAQKTVNAGHEVYIISNTTGELKSRDKKINLILFKGLGDLKSYVSNLPRLVQSLRTIKPDILHIHGNLLTILIWFINGITRIPFTCYVGETLDILSNFYKNLFIFVLKSAKKIFVSSTYIKQQLIEQGIAKDNIEVIHLGIDDRYYKPMKKIKEEYDVLFFGDSKKERGFDIVANLVEKTPQQKFLILLRWQEDDAQRSLEIVQKLKNATVMTYPYPKPLLDYILSSKTVLLPFRFMGVRPPVSILEAMLLSKPVITSTMKGNEEVIMHNKNGVLDDFSNLDKTQESLTKLLSNQKKREIMGKHARERILSIYTQEQYESVINTLNLIAR